MARGKIILASKGLNVSKTLQEEIKKDGDLTNKKIMLFCEPYFSVLDSIVATCERIGFVTTNIYTPDRKDAGKLIQEVDYIYVTEGNTFAILANLRNSGRAYFEKIREAVLSGATYIGASAGAAIAGKSVEHVAVWKFDPNHKRLTNFEGLGLVDGLIFPHMNEEELSWYRDKHPEELYCVSEDGAIIL